MQIRKSERRLVENEAYFRQQNELVQKSLDKIKRYAAEDNQDVPIPDAAEVFYFYCECADENCHERIKLSLKEYTKIHKQRSRFVVEPGHEVPGIERVTRKEQNFYVVKKLVAVPEHAPHLQPTPIHNA